MSKIIEDIVNNTVKNARCDVQRKFETIGIHSVLGTEVNFK